MSITLTDGQQNAENAILTGHNVFLTGNGGTGKSYVAQDVIAKLQRKKRKVVICAPTGIAAQVLGGVTIHSAFQFDIAPKIADELSRVKVSKTIGAADVLVIDEVGMVRRDIMDAIARVVSITNDERSKRGRRKLQVVTLGDFGQIPPIVTRSDEELFDQVYGYGFSPYAFASDGWKTLGLEPIVLTETIRQTDTEFVEALDEARIGDPKCLPYLNRLAHRGAAPDDAIVIIGQNRRADNINDTRLRDIDAPSVSLIGYKDGTFPDSEMRSPLRLNLKKGARVMITANDTSGRTYMNGSVGTVVDLDGADDPRDDDTFVTVALDDGSEVYVRPNTWSKYSYSVIGSGRKAVLQKVQVGSFKQYPLRLAWAVTYHKSQGQTFDKVSIDPYTFGPGMLYVGLSRARTPDGVWLTREIMPHDLNSDESVVSFYQTIGETKTYEPPRKNIQETSDKRSPKEPKESTDESKADDAPDEKVQEVPSMLHDDDVMAIMSALLNANTDGKSNEKELAGTYGVSKKEQEHDKPDAIPNGTGISEADIEDTIKALRWSAVIIEQDHLHGDKARRKMLEALFKQSGLTKDASCVKKAEWVADLLDVAMHGHRTMTTPHAR